MPMRVHARERQRRILFEENTEYWPCTRRPFLYLSVRRMGILLAHFVVSGKNF
jgi:hypothetical protein